MLLPGCMSTDSIIESSFHGDLIENGKKADDFTLTTHDNQTYNFNEETEGKVTIIAFLFIITQMTIIHLNNLDIHLIILKLVIIQVLIPYPKQLNYYLAPIHLLLILHLFLLEMVVTYLEKKFKG